MSRFPLSFKEINQTVLLAAIIALAYKRGHFAGTSIPSPFQVLFVISIILTIIYVLKEYTLKEFFRSFPRKMVVAFSCLFFSVLLGWAIGSVFVGIPTTHSTIQDFGTFTMSIITFFLVLFYTKDDQKYAMWCLYALLIPNIYIFYFFFTHGFVGYWGVGNDNSLAGILDPNLLSKTLLIPALFFISMPLFAAKNKKWPLTAGYIIIGSLYAMLIFWTVSRGSILSLIAGALLVWVLFSARTFTWKKILGAGAIVLITLWLGYTIVPHGVKHGLHTKVITTGTLPHSSNGKIENIVTAPTVTVTDLKAAPHTDVRIYEWSYFLKYALHHPLGVGPSASSVDYQDNDGQYVQLRPGNTYIQVWLWGGVIALTSFLYIIWSTFCTLWIKWKRAFSAEVIALFGILFALSIAIIFDASLYVYWYFIILALASQKNGITENNASQ